MTARNFYLKNSMDRSEFLHLHESERSQTGDEAGVALCTRALTRVGRHRT